MKDQPIPFLRQWRWLGGPRCSLSKGNQRTSQMGEIRVHVFRQAKRGLILVGLIIKGFKEDDSPVHERGTHQTFPFKRDLYSLSGHSRTTQSDSKLVDGRVSLVFSYHDFICQMKVPGTPTMKKALKSRRLKDLARRISTLRTWPVIGTPGKAIDNCRGAQLPREVLLPWFFELLPCKWSEGTSNRGFLQK